MPAATLPPNAAPFAATSTEPSPRRSPAAGVRLWARSADEAAIAIRQTLGPDARVLSVRSVRAPGFSGLFGSTRLEVIAERGAPAVPAPAPVSERAAAPSAAAPGEGPGEPAPVPEQVAAGEGSGRLAAMLRSAGLSEATLERLRAMGTWETWAALPLHAALAEARRALEQLADAKGTRPVGPVVGFLGPAGAGRTTVLCKWMSDAMASGCRSGRVVAVEFDRPQSLEKLAMYCELLGVECGRHAPADPPAPGEFCAFDLPPLTLGRPDEMVALREYLDRQRITSRVLVLPALADTGMLRAYGGAGLELGCTHLALTHLDELPRWGRLWDLLLDGPLSPLLLATGPALSGERESDPIRALARRTLPVT